MDGTSTLGFKILPLSMQICKMLSNALSGSIKLADLPNNVEVLYLHKNQLKYGKLDLFGRGRLGGHADATCA